ncbi:MAG: FAD-binding protein [Chitinophagaceae bacterium]|nr:FAD-binding protein [Oligoflexus sp.]
MVEQKLSDYAYYRTGGQCQALYEPKDINELSSIVRQLYESKTPYFVLGGGTNSLVWDDYYPGAVILFTKMKKIVREGYEFICEAGVENTTIAEAGLKASMSGVSWMNRLPGQIGATVRMNARCYEGEISHVVSLVRAVLFDGSIVNYTPLDGIFRGYKDTLFMDNGAIVAEVALSLTPGDRDEIEAHMKFCEDDRVRKEQFTYPTCGCVFKNNYDVGISSGMLLEYADAKKLNAKNVALNPKHSNFVYNKGASSREILEFTFEMRELVFQKFGVWLKYEMEILGQLDVELQYRLLEDRPTQVKAEEVGPLREVFLAKQRKGV